MATVDVVKDENILKYFGYVIYVLIGYKGMVCATDVYDRAERLLSWELALSIPQTLPAM